MGSRVVMESIGYVILGIFHFITNGIVRPLVPIGVAHQNQVVGILANSGDNLVCIIPNFFPALLLRFIENFEDNIVISAISFRHLGEKLGRFFQLFIGGMGMPVDNYINVVLDSGHHGSPDKFPLCIWILDIPLCTTPVFGGANGKADNFHFHVTDHGSNA